MKSITLENGKKVQISEESYEALQRAVQKKDVLVREEGETIFYPSPGGNMISLVVSPHITGKLKPFECLKEEIFAKGSAFIYLLNYMHRVNNKFTDRAYFINRGISIDSICSSAHLKLLIYFSSYEIAKQALEDCRELFEIIYK